MEKGSSRVLLGSTLKNKKSLSREMKKGFLIVIWMVDCLRLLKRFLTMFFFFFLNEYLFSPVIFKGFLF